MVRQPEVFRPAEGHQPGHLDGHGAGAPVGSGAAELVRDNQQHRTCSSEEVLQGDGRRITADVRSVSGDVSTAEVTTSTDEGQWPIVMTSRQMAV